MRNVILAVALLASLPLLAQSRRSEDPPGLGRCCLTKVYDAAGREFGDVLVYEVDRQLEYVMMRYRLKDGDTIALRVSYEYALTNTMPGGSMVIFTSNDCSGDAFVPMGRPQPTIRQAVILPVGSSGFFNTTGALLYVSKRLATRELPPPGTVFHSQWGDTGSCVPYPAPGYVYSGAPVGGFWMTRVEDLYKSYKRPFYFK